MSWGLQFNGNAGQFDAYISGRKSDTPDGEIADIEAVKEYTAGQANRHGLVHGSATGSWRTEGGTSSFKNVSIVFESGAVEERVVVVGPELGSEPEPEPEPTSEGSSTRKHAVGGVAAAKKK